MPQFSKLVNRSIWFFYSILHLMLHYLKERKGLAAQRSAVGQAKMQKAAANLTVLKWT